VVALEDDWPLWRFILMEFVLDAGRAVELGILVNQDAVLVHGGESVFDELAAGVEARCAEEDVVSLTLAGGFGGVHFGRHIIHVKPLTGDLQRPNSPIHADDLIELLLLEKLAKQTAFATSQVQHPSGTGPLQSDNNLVEPLLVEADRPFELLLLALGASFNKTLGRLIVLLSKPCNCLSGKAGTELQSVAGR
jgi:hypothetical protein